MADRLDLKAETLAGQYFGGNPRPGGDYETRPSLQDLAPDFPLFPALTRWAKLARPLRGGDFAGNTLQIVVWFRTSLADCGL